MRARHGCARTQYKIYGKLIIKITIFLLKTVSKLRVEVTFFVTYNQVTKPLKGVRKLNKIKKVTKI